MTKCKSCGTESKEWLCPSCAEKVDKWHSKLDYKDKRKGWKEPTYERSTEEIAEQIREKEGDEAAKRYLDAVAHTEQTKKEPPMWRRSSGELIAIYEMSRFHLSGAMNIVHQYIEEQQDETGKLYLECAPDVYFHLKEEMEYRGMHVPDFVDPELEVPE